MAMTPQRCEAFWAIADANDDGELTVQELMAAVHQFMPSITDKEVVSMFYGIDKNVDKKISKKEFLDEMAEKPKRSETLLKLFKQYDTNNDDALSTDEIRKLIVDSNVFKPEIVDEAVKEIIQQCDASGDGRISFDEFKLAC